MPVYIINKNTPHKKKGEKKIKMLSLRLGGKKTNDVVAFVKTHGNALRGKWSSGMSFKHMMWRLRYQFRQAAGSPRKHGGRTRFGYDAKSYSQNFDDGSWVL